jgi:hypothetical protein
MNSGDMSKATAHLGRALHYGVGTDADRVTPRSYTYETAIGTFDSFVMSAPEHLYTDEQPPSVRFPTGKMNDEDTYNELVDRGYTITSAQSTDTGISAILTAVERQAGASSRYSNFKGKLMAAAERHNKRQAEQRSRAESAARKSSAARK